MSRRRIGAEDSETRAALLDAAHALMIEDGYAAVTSRKVAARAGLKPQLVHYYFRTMDDLLLALFRRGAERNLERHARALASEQPLWALWEFSNDPAGTAFTVELMALANHRTAIRADVAQYAERFRRREVEAVTRILEGYGVDTGPVPTIVLLVLLSSVTRVLALEDGLGLRLGHEETRKAVERYLTELEGPRPPRAARERR